MSPVHRVHHDVTDDMADARDLADTATVKRAADTVREAVAKLAARPLDEDTTKQMQAALQQAETPAVRRAVRRLREPSSPRPVLSVVPAFDECVSAVNRGGDAA